MKKNLKIISTNLLFLLSFLSSHSQFTHAGRGMYVDKFFRKTLNSAGIPVIDQNLSILGIPAKEDALLEYAKTNHFTYLVLYDIGNVLGDPTSEGYLCSFIEKAETRYCIEKIGIAGSCSGLFDNVAMMAPTPPYIFNTSSNAILQNPLSFVQNTYQPGDSLFYNSEAIKSFLRAMDFNDNCAYKIDVFVTEYEFWRDSDDECTSDKNISADNKFIRYQNLVIAMDATRDNYNATHSPHKVYTEAYTGYFDHNILFTYQAISSWLDGTYGPSNSFRRLDRINTHYYNLDGVATFYWNNTGYYLNRFLELCSSFSSPAQTYVHPIMSSEYMPWGAQSNYLGYWFNQNIHNNVFTAEKNWYNEWLSDAGNNVHSTTYGNVVHPGGVQWYTSSQMVGHLDNPVMFTSNSPVCIPTGQNGSFSFQYQGPIEQGLNFKFYITDAGGSGVQCGSTNSINWPAYDPATQSSIDLNDALGSCSLPVGDYEAHLELTYAGGCSTYVVPPVIISITNSGSIVAFPSTTVCQGNPVYLQASSSGGGTTTYQWYNGATLISGATSEFYAPNPSSTGVHNYSCEITSSVTGCSLSQLANAVAVTINTFPAATIIRQSTNLCNVTLQATPAGMTYLWGDGVTTSSTFTTGSSGIYSVNVSSAAGCSRTATYDYEKIHISLVDQPINSCFDQSTGSFTVHLFDGVTPYSLVWSGTQSGSASNLTLGDYTINNLSTGTYQVTVTDFNGCSRTLSTNPFVDENLQITATSSSTPSTCPNSNDGIATVTGAGGDGGPYTYLWTFNNSTSNSITGIPSGNYIVTITDGANCSMTTSVNVPFVNSTLIPTVSISPTSPICFGSSITFTAAASNQGSSPQFEWSTNGGTTWSSPSSNTIFTITSPIVGSNQSIQV